MYYRKSVHSHQVHDPRRLSEFSLALYSTIESWFVQVGKRQLIQWNFSGVLVVQNFYPKAPGFSSCLFKSCIHGQGKPRQVFVWLVGCQLCIHACVMQPCSIWLIGSIDSPLSLPGQQRKSGALADLTKMKSSCVSRQCRLTRAGELNSWVISNSWVVSPLCHASTPSNEINRSERRFCRDHGWGAGSCAVPQRHSVPLTCEPHHAGLHISGTSSCSITEEARPCGGRRKFKGCILFYTNEEYKLWINYLYYSLLENNFYTSCSDYHR
jgi:hypothetical protein